MCAVEQPKRDYETMPTGLEPNEHNIYGDLYHRRIFRDISCRNNVGRIWMVWQRLRRIEHGGRFYIVYID